jgi:transcriptional regulator with XRE-family HTH domain
MPASVGRHNLARIRKYLKLTQRDVAQLAGCSAATIKSVEIGKLALSESLALRISHSLGVLDKDWLLKNDLTAPIPYRFSSSSPAEADDQTVSGLTVVLVEMFARLFAVVAKMEKSTYRKSIEMFIDISADAVRKEKNAIPGCQPNRLAGHGAIEFFVRNPGLFDLDLRKWVNLKGLLKSNLELSTPWSDESENIDQRAREAEESLEKAKAIEQRLEEEWRIEKAKELKREGEVKVYQEAVAEFEAKKTQPTKRRKGRSQGRSSP